VVLSSGERTIATTMSEVGRRVKAGQSVRLLDIPAARRFGAWDELHGAAAGSAFSDAIKRGAATHHGHAGREFVQRLTRDDRDLIERLNRIKDLPQFAVSNGEGQERRAAGRFALFALAGELATEYGLTGWPQGAAIDAAAECFRAWRAERGRGNDERRQILDAVASFIDKHGDSRFSSASGESYDNQKAVHQRAGWWRDEGLPDSRVYLFNKDGLREALKSFDFGRALDVLQQEKVLPPPTSGGERSRSERINAAGGTRRVYPIDSGQLRAGDGA
jgi:putative DNA primase/helicase